MPRNALRLSCVATTLLVVLGCRLGDEERPAEPGPPEPTHGVVKLSREAQDRAGLLTAKLSRQSVRASLTLAGWLATVPGREVVVRAPVAGILLPDSSREEPKPGLSVSAGQALGTLDVFLAPQDLAQTAAGIAETALAARQAQVAMRFAEAQLDRLRKAPGTVPASKLADLEEALARSRVAFEEAEKKRRLLPEDRPDGSLRWKTLPLSTPIAGRVTAVHVAPGQRVGAGDPLWTVAEWSLLWVRVPVFEGDLPRIDLRAQVRVAAAEGLETVLAMPTEVPRSANVGQRTVDLVYEMENPSGRYYPGQAVTVTAYLGSKAERIVVPASAVLWEGAARASCYVRAGDDEFVRRAIELGPPAEGGFVAQRGLAEGEEVVTVGSEALRGEEFKGSIPTKED